MLKRLSMAAVLLAMLAITPASMVAERVPEAQGKKAAAEQHPHIRAAIQELREARRELETAAHDFGGHRKEALESVDAAIKQLQAALQYDKK
jgi:hypothetical protein